MEGEYIKIGKYILQNKPFDSGSYGQVHICKDDEDNFFAAKRIPIKEDTTEKLSLNEELQAYSKLKDDHIIKLHTGIRSKTHIYLLLEYCNGKNLYQILENFVQKFNKPFTLEIIQFLAKEITKGMVYMCMHNFVHRDLKLHNIMLTKDLSGDPLKMKLSKISESNSISKLALYQSEKINSHENLFQEEPPYFKAKTIEEFTTEIKKYQVKIIDLGFVKQSDENIFTSFRGTLEYMAPEIPNQKYCNKVDLWSFGCVLYYLAFTCLPFRGNPLQNEYNSYIIPKVNNNIITYEFVDLINGLLRNDSNLRYDWDIVMNHPFLNDDITQQEPITEKIELNANNSFNYFVKDIKLKKRMIDMEGNEINKKGKISEKCFYRFDSGGKHHEGIIIGETVKDDWLLITDNGGDIQKEEVVEKVSDKCQLF